MVRSRALLCIALVACSASPAVVPSVDASCPSTGTNSAAGSGSNDDAAAGDAWVDASAVDLAGSDAPGVRDAGSDAEGAASDADEDDAGPKMPPRAMLYGDSHVTVTMAAKLEGGLGATWEAHAWQSHGGWSTPEIYFAAPTDLASFAAEKTRTRRVLIYWEGSNDVLRHDEGCVAYERFTRERVAEGWTVVLLTALPNAQTVSAAYPKARWNALNAYLRGSAPTTWGASAVVDIAADSQLSDPSGAMYMADQLHLSDAGEDRVASLLVPVVQTLYVSP